MGRRRKLLIDGWMGNRQIYAFHSKSEKYVTGWIGGWVDKRMSGLID
jgi:hypothetical protein